MKVPRFLYWLACGAVALVLPLTLAAQTADPPGDEAPVDVGVTPSFISLSLSPGSRERVPVTVYNKVGKTEARYKVYLGPLAVAEDGQYILDASDERSRNLLSFIAITPQEFVIPAGGSTTIDLIVTVPLSAAFETQQVILFVENISADQTARDAQGNVISIHARVGIPIFATIDAPGGALQSKVEDPTLLLDIFFDPLLELSGGWRWNWRALGRPHVQALLSLRNTGNAYTVISGNFAFTGPKFFGGLFGEAQTVPLKAKPILQGTNRTLVVEWPTPPVFGTVMVTADLEVEDGKPLRLTAKEFVMPWQLVVIFLAILVLITLGLILRARRKGAKDAGSKKSVEL